MFLQTGLNRRQMKQICEKFGCKKKNLPFASYKSFMQKK